MNVLSNLIVVVNLQYVQILNHHIAHLIYLFLNYTS